MPDIKKIINQSRSQEVEKSLNEILDSLKEEGLSVEFGKIGTRTTYAMIYDESHDIEIVGYTFLRDLKFYKENTGKLKALQQALARKESLAEAK